MFCLPFLVKVVGRSVLLVGLPETVDNTVDMDLKTVHNNLVVQILALVLHQLYSEHLQYFSVPARVMIQKDYGFPIFLKLL